MEPPQKPATAPLTAPKPKPAAPVVPATPALAPAAVTAPVITTEQWFLRGDDGETFGPVDRPTLNAWQAEGRMTADSQLLKQGTEQWQWASDLYPDLEEPEEPAAATAPAASSSIHREDGQQSRIRPTPSSKDSPAPEADDDEEVGLSPHSKPVAFLLALTLGMFGIHRFYLGYVGIGLAMFFTFGGLLMWSITDALRILFGHVPDAEGLKLRD